MDQNYALPSYFLPLACLLAAMMLLPPRLSAQESDTPEFHPYIFLNGNLQGVFPTQRFKDFVQEQGYGGGGLFLFQLGPRPIFAGLEASFQRLDSETVSYDEIINGVVEQFDETTKVNIFSAHVVFRVQPKDYGLFRPYIDGLVGVKDLFTRTTVENVNTEERNSETNQQDWSLSYGIAGGLQLGFFRNEAVTVDLRAVYLTGDNATFMARRPDAIGPFFAPIDAFELKNAPASLISLQLGVTVDLSTVDYY